jgi:hypothetical protein
MSRKIGEIQEVSEKGLCDSARGFITKSELTPAAPAGLVGEAA